MTDDFAFDEEDHPIRSKEEAVEIIDNQFKKIRIYNNLEYKHLFGSSVEKETFRAFQIISDLPDNYKLGVFLRIKNKWPESILYASAYKEFAYCKTGEGEIKLINLYHIIKPYTNSDDINNVGFCNSREGISGLEYFRTARYTHIIETPLRVFPIKDYNSEKFLRTSEGTVTSKSLANICSNIVKAIGEGLTMIESNDK